MTDIKQNEVYFYVYAHERHPRAFYGCWPYSSSFRQFLISKNVKIDIDDPRSDEELLKEYSETATGRRIEIVTREEWLANFQSGHYHAEGREVYQAMINKSTQLKLEI